MFGWQYFQLSIVIAIIEFILKPYQAIALSDLISFYADSTDESIRTDINQYTSASSLIICSFLYVSLSHPFMLASYHLGMKIRIACSNLMYEKVLKLNKSAFKETTQGQIINIFSSDLNIFDRFTLVTHYVWIGPLQSILIFYILYRNVGISALFGILLLLLFIPLFIFIGKMVKKYRLKTSKIRDERVRLMNEIINGIKVIKMYVWEKPFSRNIASHRSRELKAITILSYLKGTFLLYSVFITTSIFVTIAFAILFKEPINAKNVFLVTSLLYTLGTSLTFFFVQGIALFGETTVSINRLTTFLLLEEMPQKLVRNNRKNVVITNGSASWEKEKILKEINIHIESNYLTTVIGPVGSGKSTLLQIILGELSLDSGIVKVNGSLSYAPQEPWLFSGSIKQNILFGNKIDMKRYLEVIKVCALEEDFKSLPCGDKTLVGNKGASLSRGQNARINLARAVYKDADVYLLDDPFSAIDAKVGNEIFENCVQKFLKGKTVLLSTHQLQYIKYADQVLLIQNNCVKKEYPERSGFDLDKCLQQIENDETSDNSKIVQIPKSVDEQKAVGFISLSVYKNYIFVSQSKVLIFVTVLIFVLTQIAYSGSFWFIAYSVNLIKKYGDDLLPTFYIYIYCAIMIAHIILTLLRSLTFIKLAMQSSKVLHKWMYLRVIRTTLNFFSVHPPGRILNRFTKDLTTIDEILPNTILLTIRTLLSILGIFVVICIVNPFFLIPTAVISIIFYYLRKFYLTASFALVRVDSITRSHLYGHLSTTLQGLPVIRAFGVEKILTEEFHNHQDLQSSAFYSYLSANRAFGYWTDTVCFIYLIIVLVYYTLIGNVTQVGNIGLVIIQTIQLLGQLQMGVKLTTETENHMVSVERVLEYTAIERERSLGLRSPPSWPTHGRITFIDVFLKYDTQNPYALKNLNFTIQPQEKVGIVGRTGAGKSSLVAALLELTKTEGAIIIDRINIKKIKLRDLRKKISIIPQDPMLFSGTVRQNLDPFCEHNDDVLWKALEEVKLKDVISDLELEVFQDGLNWSVGQRQLISLARAIIQQNKILILDEATANVDRETDCIIQETIKKNFSLCTVLTIAHRLNTVENSDRIMVMKDGEIVEFERPDVLLRNHESEFYKMLQQSNNYTVDSLVNIT
ncbi:hypothetical protein RN001_007257 [Aquatica leii]|uniref:Uncharacterized protein n=1 Tax=Aquatica leii TaxID=1421715 RepID=A0AAN7PCV2_9COLE|nr:hypothetical protein RN001_007257 [Aquatica leii]